MIEGYKIVHTCKLRTSRSAWESPCHELCKGSTSADLRMVSLSELEIPNSLSALLFQALVNMLCWKQFDSYKRAIQMFFWGAVPLQDITVSLTKTNVLYLCNVTVPNSLKKITFDIVSVCQTHSNDTVVLKCNRADEFLRVSSQGDTE